MHDIFLETPPHPDIIIRQASIHLLGSKCHPVNRFMSYELRVPYTYIYNGAYNVLEFTDAINTFHGADIACSLSHFAL